MNHVSAAPRRMPPVLAGSLHAEPALGEFMRNVIRIILGVILLLIILVQTRPNTYHVERSQVIAAPTEAIYGKLVDFHQWSEWSPWAKIDPNMKTTYTGAASGVGQIYEWTGNDKVGSGRMTLSDAQPSDKVGIKLEFIKPFAATCQTGFVLALEGSGTKVTWSMDGTNNFMAKAISMFGSMDKMIGPDFEKGLSQLKTASEAAPAAATPAAAPADAAGKPAGK